MTEETISTTPWYKQFWPWFIIALPASVVVAGLSTVYIAFHYADTLVDDDYYKDGLAINQTLALDTRAQELGLKANIRFDQQTGEVFVDLSGEVSPTDKLELLLLHPVDEKADRQIMLISLGDGHYRADLDEFPRHRYYLRLKPQTGADWRLNGELDFERSRKIVLNPNV